MKNLFYHVLDIETSDISASVGGEIIELAIITCKDLEIIDIYHSYFSCSKMNPGAAAVHKLSIDQLRNWPSIKNNINTRNELSKLLKYPIFAHNANFDLGFLKFYKIITESHPFVDTLSLCRKENIGPKGNKLTDWTTFLGISHKPHNALSDAFALCGLISTKNWQHLSNNMSNSNG